MDINERIISKCRVLGRLLLTLVDSPWSPTGENIDAALKFKIVVPHIDRRASIGCEVQWLPSDTRRRRRGPRRWELRLLSSLLAVSSRHPSVHFFVTNIHHIEIDQLVGVSENDHVLTLGGFLYEFFGKAVPFIILAGVFFFSSWMAEKSCSFVLLTIVY